MAGTVAFPFQLKVLNNELFALNFTFLPNGTGAPTLLQGEGITSLVRDGVGVYTVTLDDVWDSLANTIVSIQLGTLADTQVQATSEDVDGVKSVTFTILTAGIAADVTGTGADRIKCTLLLTKTKVVT